MLLDWAVGLRRFLARRQPGVKLGCMGYDLRQTLRRLRRRPVATAIAVADARGRHRRDDGHLQRRTRRRTAAAAVCTPGPAGARLAERPRAWAALRRDVLSDVQGLAREPRRVRGPRGLPEHESGVGPDGSGRALQRHRAAGVRELLQRPRSRAGSRPRPPARGRPAGGGARRRPQSSPLAHPVRLGPGHRGTCGRARQRAVHGRRRDARELRVPGRRRAVDARRPGRERARGAARSLVDERARPAPTRGHAGAGASRHGGDRDGLQPGQVPGPGRHGRPDAPGGRRARPHSPGAARVARRGGARPARRLRERGGAAGPCGGRAGGRAGRADGSRRERPQARARAGRREPRRRRHRWRPRRARRDRGHSAAGRAVAAGRASTGRRRREPAGIGGRDRGHPVHRRLDRTRSRHGRTSSLAAGSPARRVAPVDRRQQPLAVEPRRGRGRRSPSCC